MLLSIALLALITAPQTAADPTLPPADAHVKTTVVGLGVQVYQCLPKNGIYKWTLQMPEATLFDPATHQEVGTHSAGPTWTWKDGSEITGRVLQTRPSDNAANIPWLLVETHSTGAASGELAGVTLVRRFDTQAGSALEGCDAVHQNNVERVPYQATYTFYTTSK